MTVKACVSPIHLGPFLWCHARKRWVLVDPSAQELHDVERSANHAAIITQTVRFRHWYVGLFKRADDPEFAIHLVRGLGQKLARRSLSHHEFFARPVRELVGWVGLAISKLGLLVSRHFWL